MIKNIFLFSFFSTLIFNTYSYANNEGEVFPFSPDCSSSHETNDPKKLFPVINADFEVIIYNYDNPNYKFNLSKKYNLNDARVANFVGDRIYVGVWGGVYVFDATNFHLIQEITSSNHSLVGDEIVSFEFNDHLFFVGTTNGISIFNIKDLTVATHIKDKSIRSSKSQFYVFQVSNEHLYASVNDKVVVFNLFNFNVVKEFEIKGIIKDNVRATSIEITSKFLLISSLTEIHVFDIKTFDLLKTIDLTKNQRQENSQHSVCVQSLKVADDYLLISTNATGIQILSLSTIEAFKLLPDFSSLKSNLEKLQIKSISSDHLSLFIATNNGVLVFDRLNYRLTKNISH